MQIQKKNSIKFYLVFSSTWALQWTNNGWVDEIIARCCGKNPTRRYSSSTSL